MPLPCIFIAEFGGNRKFHQLWLPLVLTNLGGFLQKYLVFYALQTKPEALDLRILLQAPRLGRATSAAEKWIAAPDCLL